MMFPVVLVLLFSFTLSNDALPTQSAGPWSTATLSTAFDQPAGATAGTKVLFGGGFASGSPTALVDVFDTQTNQRSTAALSSPRFWVGSTSSADKTRAFFVGGTQNNVASRTVDIFNSLTTTWSSTTISAPGRYLVSAASLGTKVYFGGGTIGSGSESNVDVYDYSTDTMTQISPGLSVKRSSVGVAAVGTKVLFAGGNDPNLNPQAVVDIYDTQLSSWAAPASLSSPRDTVAAVTLGTKAYFAGGSNRQGASNVVDIYESTNGAWTTATLSVARSYIAATVVGSKILFAGGVGSDYSNVVDIYDSTTDKWSTSTLSVARAYIGAASVGTKAYFAGGSNRQGASNVVDIFDSAYVPPPPASPCYTVFACDGSGASQVQVVSSPAVTGLILYRAGNNLILGYSSDQNFGIVTPNCVPQPGSSPNCVFTTTTMSVPDIDADCGGTSFCSSLKKVNANVFLHGSASGYIGQCTTNPSNGLCAPNSILTSTPTTNNELALFKMLNVTF